MLKDLKIRLIAGLAACACVFGACGFMVQSGFAVANADAVEESDNPSVTDVTAPFTQGSLGDFSQAQNDNGEEYSLEIVSKNVSYSDSIYMLYAVANDGFDRTQNQIQLLFWESEQTEYVIGTEKSSVTTLKSATLKGESCLVFYSHGIAAKEMNDLVYCRAYVEVDGVAVYSDVVKYSVVDYVYEMRANHTLTEKQKKMFTEMLDYGAAAQDLLGYRTDAFANATYYTVTVENGTLEDGFAYGRYAKNAEATLKADELGGGLTFSHWEDENGVNVGSTETQKVSVTENKTYTAIYCDEFIYELSSGKDYYTIMGYQGNGGAVTIPSTFMGLPVRAISVDAFAGNTTIQSVVIEKGIVTIGHRAFKGCTALTSVVVKSGVTTIGKQAFYGCSKLVSVTLPDTVSSIADEFTFYACPKLESITVDDDNAYYEDIDGNLYTKGGLTLIRYAVGKTATELVLPESVTEIAPSALRDSLNLTKVVLPKSVAKIGLYAFRNCPKLTIYAMADSAPEGWVADWNPNNRPVVWGYRLPTSANVFDYIIEDESVTITRYRGEDTEVIIPSIIEGKPVTKIDSLAFYYFPELESVEIPDCVISIGSNAFTGTQLTSIELPNSLIELGDYAFPYSNFTYNEYNYGKYIGNEENPYMALVRGNSNGIIHEDTRFIVDEAFRNTGVSSVDIHENILSIGVGAFRECDNLRTMVIPDNVTHLGGWAISQCGNLTEVTIGTGITSIELCMFQYNYNMHTIHFRGDIKRIEHTSFFLCTNLTNLVLPTGLEYIGQNAFEYCGELKEIVIPASVEEIGNAAFHYTGLTKVVFENPENWMAFDWDSYDIIVNPIEIGSVANEETAALYLTDTYYNKIWRNTTSWFEYALNADGESYTVTKFLGAQRGAWVNDEREIAEVLVPATYQGLPVTTVGAYTFQENSDLQTIVFADGITEIENYAIYNCSSLTSVVIPNSITNIGDDAFYQDYWWSGGIYNEYDNAYYWGNSSNPYLVLMEAKSIDITACEIHPSTKFIMGNAFESCAKLESIIIPNGVTSIGGYAFSGCKGLTNITIPETLMRVGRYAFNGCDNLQYTEYDNAYYLGNEGNPYHVLLKGVSNDITSCEIHPDTKVIAGNALYFCQKISEIEIPNGVISIGYDAFYAYSLAKITIPISVSYIESGAFSGSYSSTIYCEAESEPSGWEKNWCAENTPVVWNYRENNVASDGCVYVYENGLRYALRDGEAVVVRQRNTLTEAEILAEISYNGQFYPVTEIGIGAFIGCYNLTTVTIPEGIVKISDYAFYYTDSLQDIIIPDSVTSIGYDAFSSMNYRKNFTTLVIGAGLEYIAEDAFYTANRYLQNIIVSEDNMHYTAIDGNLYTKDGKTLVLYAAGKGETEFVIPDGVTHVSEFAFTCADTLTKIILPESLVSAGRWSFYRVDCLQYNEYKGAYYVGMGDNPYYLLAYADYNADVFEIPASTKIVSPDVLYNGQSIFVDENNPYYQSIDGNLYTKDGKKLVQYAGAKTETEFVIPDGVEVIGEYAFMYAEALKNLVIPNSVKSIGKWAFYGCSSLEKVVLPEGITTISDSAFAWCESLRTIEIPETVKTIEYNAFYNCTSLETIVIPNTVEVVESRAFDSCPNLKIICEAGRKPSGWSKYWNYSNCPVVWAVKEEVEVLEETPAEAFVYSITDGKVTITDYVGSYVDIVIPAMIEGYPVTSIGRTAFQYCTAIKSVVIPEGVTEIGMEAFSTCTNMVSVEIPKTVKSIVFGAFEYCSALESVTIPYGVTYIDQAVFVQCDSLTSVVLPNTVTGIGNCAFLGCDNLETVIIPDSVTSLSYWVFDDCPKLTLYCEAESRPDGWYGSYDCPVVWGYNLDGRYFDEAYQFEGGKATVRIDEAGESVYFAITVTETRTYTLYSKVLGVRCDTCAELYDENYNLIATDDDSWGDRQFKITCNLTEGETYYISVSLFDSSAIGEVEIVIE